MLVYKLFMYANWLFSCHQIERAHDEEWHLTQSAYGNDLISVSQLHCSHFGIRSFLNAAQKWTLPSRHAFLNEDGILKADKHLSFEYVCCLKSEVYCGMHKGHFSSIMKPGLSKAQHEYNLWIYIMNKNGQIARLYYSVAVEYIYSLAILKILFPMAVIILRRIKQQSLRVLHKHRWGGETFLLLSRRHSHGKKL